MTSRVSRFILVGKANTLSAQIAAMRGRTVPALSSGCNPQPTVVPRTGIGNDALRRTVSRRREITAGHLAGVRSLPRLLRAKAEADRMTAGKDRHFIN